jgi:hypothetical protein
MADTDSSKSTSTARGCALAIGILFLFCLMLVALCSTYITSVLTNPQDAAWFAVITVILWAVWIGVLVLLIRALPKKD